MIPLFDASWAVIDCKPRASGDDPVYYREQIEASL